mmetsp:Transcript_13991/g.37572  ORF Transcript_13991/g.37572 Transcript_13991/m.37572 type:complete len:126 (-) Transcript_13991:1118-1495(-)
MLHALTKKIPKRGPLQRARARMRRLLLNCAIRSGLHLRGFDDSVPSKNIASYSALQKMLKVQVALRTATNQWIAVCCGKLLAESKRVSKYARADKARILELPNSRGQSNALVSGQHIFVSDESKR